MDIKKMILVRRFLDAELLQKLKTTKSVAWKIVLNVSA